MSTKNYRNMIIISSVILLSLVLSACGPKEATITIPEGAQEARSTCRENQPDEGE